MLKTTISLRQSLDYPQHLVLVEKEEKIKFQLQTLSLNNPNKQVLQKLGEPTVLESSRPFQGGTSFVGHLFYLCLVFLMLLRLFIAALWSPAGKGLTSWPLLVMFIVFSLLSHVVSRVRCGT